MKARRRDFEPPVCWLSASGGTNPRTDTCGDLDKVMLFYYTGLLRLSSQFHSMLDPHSQNLNEKEGNISLSFVLHLQQM